MNVLRLRAFLAALAIGAFTLGATPVSPMGPVKQFVTAFNKGDAKGMAALCTPQTAILDDFPPHTWGSCSAWVDAFNAFSKQDGDTGPVVTLGTPLHVDITGNVAYVVVPTTYVYKHKGSTVTQNGSVWTLVLKRTSSAWLIASWAWADGK